LGCLSHLIRRDSGCESRVPDSEVVVVDEPVWCAFCEDAPSVGRMIVVVQHTQTEVKPERPLDPMMMRACARCGRGGTDYPVAENYSTGQVAGLQFEHDAFAKIDAAKIDALAKHLENAKCSVCGKAAEPDPSVPGLPIRQLAEKMLREYPDMTTVTTVCGECSEEGKCPHCDHDCGDCGEHEHTGQ